MEKIKINNHIKEDHVPLYNPEGKLIGIIKNELAFNDVRIQIIKNKLRGYYIIHKDHKCRIGTNGELDFWPDDLYTTYTDQLSKILGF
jgi:hypothetical protein